MCGNMYNNRSYYTDEVVHYLNSVVLFHSGTNFFSVSE